jgi:GT2 family glycosyltransferase/glycosyltransferase involved in cell wall biosynthesis
MERENATVSIIIPVCNKLPFTRQCLDRIARYSSADDLFDVIVVDNGSSDETERSVLERTRADPRVRYHRNDANLGFAKANNIGATLSSAKYLLFLNNDTLVRPDWLSAMVGLAEHDPRIGVVGMKQLFPYTNTIHHTGIVFTAERKPVHLYPHADASLSYVNKEREYQAVTGSCLLIPRQLFIECGMFDEGYLNGYEDIDLCLTARKAGRSVVCCTKSFIYHYGQISDTRTDDDDKNAARLASKWGNQIEPDESRYYWMDRVEIDRAPSSPASHGTPRTPSRDRVYFADDLSHASALTWASSELILALAALGANVTVRKVDLPTSLGRHKRQQLAKLMADGQRTGGVQIRWSHYWPQHLGLELSGRLNLELFVINYLFGQPGNQPWDFWMQCLPQNHCRKLPLSRFCLDVLMQTGVAGDDCKIISPGYSPEVNQVEPPSRRSSQIRLLSLTNSHDLERYGTVLLLEAFWKAFTPQDDVVLVLKDYGTASGDSTLRELLHRYRDKARVEFVEEFTSKERLIGLYKSCDAFVSAHRGEGYGMKILDALACGLPVVTPLFGGPTDFCTTSNCLPVDFTLAPVGACFDTQALRITNQPMWAEPSVDSLSSQLRRVVSDGELRHKIGEQGRRDVVGRFTWTNAAQQLLDAIAVLDGSTAVWRELPAVPPTRPLERSPYWLGCRVSVIVPTYNRKESLLRCLEALAGQSILPQEFEVVVVDDGSCDGTEEALRANRYSFRVKYVRQENRGPGAARNEGLRHAEGELVLYIGDDIIAEADLLEQHLITHATRTESGAAILGHIDWPPRQRRSPVMDFVCGESTLQFAYHFIPTLTSLDYRFFYTSNISLKRRFLTEAAVDGVVFDPRFTFAAFEDSEFALRLERRGLSIHYCAEAKAYHHHWMDLESFARREHRAGRMAVVFYRMHPQIDSQLEVRWIGDWGEAVERLTSSPEMDGYLRVIDAETDTFLASLAKSLEGLIDLQASLGGDVLWRNTKESSLTSLLHNVLATIFEVERTRGKIEEWYASVDDPRTVECAKRLLACIRKLEFFAVNPKEVQRLKGTIGWLDQDVIGNLRSRIGSLEQQLAGKRFWSTLRLERRILSLARRADWFLQNQLSQHASDPWLDTYRSVRGRLKRLLVPHPGRVGM